MTRTNKKSKHHIKATNVITTIIRNGTARVTVVSPYDTNENYQNQITNICQYNTQTTTVSQ